MKYKRNTKAVKLLGKRIRQLRVEQKISQAQLAFEADVRLSQIGRIERGEINTSFSTLVSIAKALDVSLKEFFDFEI